MIQDIQLVCFFDNPTSIAMIINIKVAFPVVKKLPDVLNGKISTMNNKIKG